MPGNEKGSVTVDGPPLPSYQLVIRGGLYPSASGLPLSDKKGEELNQGPTNEDWNVVPCCLLSQPGPSTQKCNCEEIQIKEENLTQSNNSPAVKETSVKSKSAKRRKSGNKKSKVNVASTQEVHILEVGKKSQKKSCNDQSVFESKLLVQIKSENESRQEQKIPIFSLYSTISPLPFANWQVNSPRNTRLGTNRIPFPVRLGVHFDPERKRNPCIDTWIGHKESVKDIHHYYNSYLDFYKSQRKKTSDRQKTPVDESHLSYVFKKPVFPGIVVDSECCYNLLAQPIKNTPRSILNPLPNQEEILRNNGHLKKVVVPEEVVKNTPRSILNPLPNQEGIPRNNGHLKKVVVPEENAKKSPILSDILAKSSRSWYGHFPNPQLTPVNDSQSFCSFNKPLLPKDPQHFHRSRKSGTSLYEKIKASLVKQEKILPRNCIVNEPLLTKSSKNSQRTSYSLKESVRGRHGKVQIPKKRSVSTSQCGPSVKELVLPDSSTNFKQLPEPERGPVPEPQNSLQKPEKTPILLCLLKKPPLLLKSSESSQPLILSLLGPSSSLVNGINSPIVKQNDVSNGNCNLDELASATNSSNNSEGLSNATIMEISRKQNPENKPGNNAETKKGKQLTSIIDQLTINKKKDSAQSDASQKKVLDYKSKQSAQQQSTPQQSAPQQSIPQQSAPQQSAQSGQSDGQLTERRMPEMPTDALAAATSAAANNATPRADRGTPDAESSSSPSISPHSPSPGRGFPSLLAAPGFAGSLRVNSVAPFSPPPGLERFSPATGNPAIKQMEMMTRNYSDFMRCLAAKYNQNNNNAQESFPMHQGNGLVRGYNAAFPYKAASPFLARNSDNDGNSSGSLTSGLTRKQLENQNSPTPVESRNNNNNNVNNNNTTLSGGGGISDFSSSQTLLNLVRTASAQSASQLETYLKGAVKRSADGEPNRLDPLDLTVGAVKRPRHELGTERDLFPADADPALVPGGEGSARTAGGGTRPSWMSLLDRRVNSSSTSSSRTSPRTLNSERMRCWSLCLDKSCSPQSEASEFNRWTVEDVVKFVSSVDTCAEFSERFRDECIDGATLTMLTEDHLIMHLGMKLGPALKLRSSVARRIGHCTVCMHCMHCHTDDNTDVRRHESSRSPTVSK